MIALAVLVVLTIIIAGQAVALDRALSRAERAERRLSDAERILHRYERKEAEERRRAGADWLPRP